MLVRRGPTKLGVAAQSAFDPGYRGLPALAELLQAAAVVVLPYDSPDQVTSGVLVDAVAAGRPVVATAFPHAVELLGAAPGWSCPRRDPVALAAALRRVLTEPGLADVAWRPRPGASRPASPGRPSPAGTPSLGDASARRRRGAVRHDRHDRPSATSWP